MTGTCPRYGVKTFNVEAGQNITVQIARNTRRCVALFRVGCENLKKYRHSFSSAAGNVWQPDSYLRPVFPPQL